MTTVKRPTARSGGRASAARATRTPRATKESRSALQRAHIGQAKAFLNRDGFLRRQGPRVIPVELAELGATVLMRRIDLLALAQAGETFEPVKSTLLRLLHDGKVVPTSGILGLADTLKTAAAVARVACVVPPQEMLDGDVDEFTVDPNSLKPLFVDKDPDADQVVLANYGVDADSGQIVADGGDESGWLHPNDLIRILASAYQFGPGALGDRFRGAAEARALATVAEVGAHGDSSV